MSRHYGITTGLLLIVSAIGGYALAQPGAAGPATPAAPGITGKAINGEALTEQGCEVLEKIEGQRAALRAAPGLNVLGRAQVAVPGAETPGAKVIAVMCWRSAARLATEDWVVPQQGYRLYIKTDVGDETLDRTISLEKVSDGFRVRLLAGPAWTKAEEEEMAEAIRLYTKSHEKNAG
jgi:hypothetical protein